MRFTAGERFVLYSELAKLLEAGFPMEKALATLDHHPLSKPGLHYVSSVRRRLDQGDSIADAVDAVEQIELGGLERNLVRAGERGGQLAAVFRHLARYFERMHEVSRAVARGLVYPFILLHLAALLPALPRLLRGDGPSAFIPSAIALGIVYGLAAAAVMGYRCLHRQSAARGRTDRLLGRVPLLGRLHRLLALERFAEVFRIYILSAFLPSDAIAAAAEASQSAHLREGSATVRDQLKGGRSLGDLLLSHDAFPKDFAAGMSTAEEAGTLDEELQRWSTHYGGRARDSFAQVEAWLPKIFYFLICGYVVWQIVAGWLVYFDRISGDPFRL